MTRKAYTGFATLADASDDLDGQRFIIQQMINRLATATLVQVKAVDPTGHTVDVQPMVHQIDGAGNAISHGTIHAMPYFTLRAGGAAVQVDPVPGDVGLAVFCHNDITAAKKNGRPSQPGSRRRYAWADGLYLGGFLGADPSVYIQVSEAGVLVKGSVDIADSLTVGTGATGSFTSESGQVVTVQSGIITTSE